MSIPGNLTTGLIDAHVHLYETQSGYPQESSSHKDGDNAPEPNPIPQVDPCTIDPRRFTHEELLKHCTPHGVNRIVLIQMIHYGEDNSDLLERIRNHPETFRGVAVVDHRRPETPQQMTALLAQKVTGFRLYGIDPRQVEQWLHSDPMNAMWSHAAETGQAICPLMEPDALTSLRKMVERHPDTRVVIDHMARIGMAGPIQQAQIDDLCRLAAFPNVFVKTSAFYALGEKRPPYLDLQHLIRQLYDAFGPHRLMWGSDSPFQVEKGHTYADSLTLIRDRLDFLSPEDKQWLLSKTAENVYWFL